MAEQMLKGFAKTSSNVLKNEAVIAVLSASIVAPYIVPKINSLLESIPILKDHSSIAAFVTGLAIFSIAGTVASRNMYLRAVIIGVAGAFILSALLPIYSSLTSKTGAIP